MKMRCTNCKLRENCSVKQNLDHTIIKSGRMEMMEHERKGWSKTLFSTTAQNCERYEFEAPTPPAPPKPKPEPLVEKTVIIKVIKVVEIPSTPLRELDELRSLIEQGVKKMCIVNDYRPYGINGKISKTLIVATGLPLKEQRSSLGWYLPIEGNSVTGDDRVWMGDRNVGEGGYNDHNLFASEHAADLYIAHLMRGGSHHQRAPWWNKKLTCNVGVC